MCAVDNNEIREDKPKPAVYENFVLETKKPEAISAPPNEEDSGLIYANFDSTKATEPIRIEDLATYISSKKGRGFKSELQVNVKLYSHQTSKT